MTIRLKQKAYRFGSRNAWKGEVAGMLFATILLLGMGLGLLGAAIFGNPHYQPGKEQPIPARAALVIVAMVLTPLAILIACQAVRTIKERHQIDENEFTVRGVTSYEVLSESEGEALQEEQPKCKGWCTY